MILPFLFLDSHLKGAVISGITETPFQEATRNKTCFLLWYWWVMLRFPQALVVRLHCAFPRVEVLLDSISPSLLSRHFCSLGGCAAPTVCRPLCCGHPSAMQVVVASRHGASSSRAHVRPFRSSTVRPSFGVEARLRIIPSGRLASGRSSSSERPWVRCMTTSIAW